MRTSRFGDRRRLFLYGVCPVVAIVAVMAWAAPRAAALDFCAPALNDCARLDVPLDRSGVVPGTVSLQVERQLAPHPTRPPLFLIAGGPGQSATSVFDPLTIQAILGPVTRNRDIYVVDLRGTGESGVLRCPQLEQTGARGLGAAVANCATLLGPRRAFYTTRDNVADIEAVRVAIGAPTIALLGISYGTQVALAYGLEHPDRVDRLVLDSPVPATGPDPLYRSSFLAAPRVMRTFCAEVGCAGITRDAGRDLSRLARRLARRPLRGTAYDAYGHAHRVAMNGFDLLDVVLSGDLDPTERAQAPGAVRNALRGDTAPIMPLVASPSAQSQPTGPNDFSVATYTATSCEEDQLPWDRTAPIAAHLAQAQQTVAALPPSAFGAFGPGAALESTLLDVCMRWPQAPIAPSITPMGTLTAPVLILSGDNDVRTPLEDARREAAMLPGARLLVARGIGHSVLGNDVTGCVTQAFWNFMNGRSFGTCPVSWPGVNAEAFPTTVRELKPVAGAGGLAGRTLAAIPLTIADAMPSFDAILGSAIFGGTLRSGGLRGGALTLSGGGSTLTLRRLTFVPGVSVSGRLMSFDNRRAVHGRLVIGGRAAARGVLEVRGRRVVGRLGGRPVRVRLSLSLSPPTFGRRRTGMVRATRLALSSATAGPVAAR